MLVVKVDELRADQVKVAASKDVEAAVSDGWRIMAMLESRHFSSSFVMGRDAPERALVGRVADAEQRASIVAGEMTKLELKVQELTKAGAQAGVASVRAQNKADELRGKLLQLSDEVGKVRKEIGDARWREILGSLEVEQILDDNKAPEPPKPEGSEIPF